MHARWCRERNEDGRRELKAKLALREGAITVREKERACGNFNFQIYENVLREHESSVKTKRVSREYSSAFSSLPCAFRLSVSANACSRHPFESDIAEIYARCDHVIFDVFKETRP